MFPATPTHSTQLSPVCHNAQTPEHLKTSTAEEAFHPNGLTQRTIRLLKEKFQDLEVGAAAATALQSAHTYTWPLACMLKPVITHAAECRQQSIAGTLGL